MHAEISALLPEVKKVDESLLEILGSPIFDSVWKGFFLLKFKLLN